MLKEFKEFALKGNMIDLAIGVIIGGAFNSLVTSLVENIIMPILSLVTGKIDFSNLFIALDGNTYKTLAAAQAAGASTVNYGLFITGLLNFLIMAFVIFMIVKTMNKLRTKTEKPVEEKPTKKAAKTSDDTASLLWMLLLVGAGTVMTVVRGKVKIEK